ncbi:hypothetical protein AB7M42_004257 [Bradyrhizobium diazoefficiens]|nr:hypothetical protein F07S3_45780 [Bradyrhizobium diazoefficiens]BCA03711.1 hypothetical protein H12S4_46150 [Bradyrhizobium diazoefficiens]BCA12427.1 hypothetical protein BDHF08_42740 [Bradyrhizobium diazoefficiens]BCA21071.1 hypothetical protein BDHH15_42860 [Bradyrhizobium diazoefficiens]BCE21706.1 hypothetical protein XF1B_43870 [Bradyrhizobium diazoefficiens]
MVRAIFMTEEQIAELVEKARLDGELWAVLKDRELNQFSDDGSAKLPSIAMAVGDFVVGLYGAEHGYEIGSLIIALRFHIRQELGLPV